MARPMYKHFVILLVASLALFFGLFFGFNYPGILFGLGCQKSCGMAGLSRAVKSLAQRLRHDTAAKPLARPDRAKLLLKARNSVAPLSHRLPAEIAPPHVPRTQVLLLLLQYLLLDKQVLHHKVVVPGGRSGLDARFLLEDPPGSAAMHCFGCCEVEIGGNLAFWGQPGLFLELGRIRISLGGPLCKRKYPPSFKKGQGFARDFL
ncbi:hypothetical protein C8J57DRAFT_1227911 [Mycena rebaudengoi]|nr:hypothetical protein C8J57DRAFT_1227911 [Mycena rebaudengoi]